MESNNTKALNVLNVITKENIPHDLLENIKFIQTNLKSNKYFKEFLDIYSKILHNNKINKHNLINIMPISNDAVIFNWKNISITIIFDNIPVNKKSKSSYLLQERSIHKLGHAVCVTTTYKKLSKVLKECVEKLNN